MSNLINMYIYIYIYILINVKKRNIQHNYVNGEADKGLDKERKK